MRDANVLDLQEKELKLRAKPRTRAAGDINLSKHRIALIAIAVFLLALGGGVFALGRADLAAVAATYLSTSIGRKVAIQSLTVKLGRPTRIEMHGVSLANMKGGSETEMVSMARLTAEVDPRTLIFGPIVVRHLSIDGARVLLEHGPQDRPNWKFGPSIRLTRKPEGRRVMPTLLGARFHNVQIDDRTSSGKLLSIRINDGTVTAAAPDKPVALGVDGAYNGIAVHADVSLPPFAALHGDVKVLPVAFKLTSGTVGLAFKGTAVDPLNADGVDGQLTLEAPKPRELLALAGLSGQFDLPLTVSSRFTRDDTRWRLAGGAGTLGGDAFKADATIQEGKRHQPDDIALEAGFAKLNLDALNPDNAPVAPAGQMSLMIDPDPGITVAADVTAEQLTYRTIQAEDFDLTAHFGPGSLSVEQIAATIAGGSARSKIAVTNHGAKGTVEFDGALTMVDVGRLAKAMGWGPLPVSGMLSSRVGGSMTGATLAEARGTNAIFAVVSMGDGTFDRHLVHLAATDIRAIFGAAIFGSRKAVTRLTCLLAVMDLRDGRGTIAPLKIRTADGTIVGGGLYDAQHDAIDVMIGTQSRTTSVFALDVPVRISGPLSNYSVRPALGSATPDITGNIGDLPADMQSFAAGSNCLAQ